jgi:hypothetical protein
MRLGYLFHALKVSAQHRLRRFPVLELPFGSSQQIRRHFLLLFASVVASFCFSDNFFGVIVIVKIMDNFLLLLLSLLSARLAPIAISVRFMPGMALGGDFFYNYDPFLP